MKNILVILILFISLIFVGCSTKTSSTNVDDSKLEISQDLNSIDKETDKSKVVTDAMILLNVKNTFEKLMQINATYEEVFAVYFPNGEFVIDSLVPFDKEWKLQYNKAANDIYAVVKDMDSYEPEELILNELENMIIILDEMTAEAIL